MAFAFNAMLGTALFGAIAVAREYGHNTVVPTFLSSPKRVRTALAQFVAVMLAGGALGLTAQVLVTGGIAVALPTTDYGFLVSAGDLSQVVAASTFAGVAGAVLGAGLGAIIRNLGGAVTAVVFVLFVIPPLIVQLVNDAGSWIPPTLGTVMSGVTTEVDVWAAFVAILAWALLPAAVGVAVIQHRDVV
jgi:hypothetical protein